MFSTSHWIQQIVQVCGTEYLNSMIVPFDRWRWKLRTINSSSRALNSKKGTFNFKRGMLNSKIGMFDSSNKALNSERGVLRLTGSRES